MRVLKWLLIFCSGLVIGGGGGAYWMDMHYAANGACWKTKWVTTSNDTVRAESVLTYCKGYAPS